MQKKHNYAVILNASENFYKAVILKGSEGSCI